MTGQQDTIARQDALIRDIMVGKLAIFSAPTARTYANISSGRSGLGGGTSATAGTKSSPGAPGSGPTAFDDDDEPKEVVMSDEEVLRDLNPTGRGGSGFVP